MNNEGLESCGITELIMVLINFEYHKEEAIEAENAYLIIVLKIARFQK